MRKLATIRKIIAIHPIPNADAIELAQVDGWQSVIKKGEYSVGDLVVYMEVDSWVPHELAPFLSKDKEPREFNGVKGERLRTIKLRGALSQGLIFPVPEGFILVEGTDCTEALGIQKWERPIPAQLAGQVKGNFPVAIPKTAQERVQNIRLEKYSGEVYELTEKLHGSSCTFYLDKENVFHVCSRNLDLKPDPNNAYWKAAYKYDVERKMREMHMQGYAIQGELCGEGINGNNYKLGLEFFAFDIYHEGFGYVKAKERKALVDTLEIPHVPIIATALYLGSVLETKEKILAHANGYSAIADCLREGFVYKSLDSDKTFKAVSNSWLLQYE